MFWVKFSFSIDFVLMLQYLQKISIDVTMRFMAWRNVKNLNQILHFWNLWVNDFQTVFRLSKLVYILEEVKF